MNTYGFVCAAVPMLMGTPVLKYSQAMGTFHSFWNRFLAKWILPKMRLICARGKGTLDNLKGIGIEKNVKLCADGAFTMADDPYYLKQVEAEKAQKDAASADKVVGLSIQLSGCFRKKCE
ncbi:MAG: polysaccharide pyruvyl transferase family protein [Lachnospiraceae bacterium]